jgi:hypothetical protein
MMKNEYDFQLYSRKFMLPGNYNSNLFYTCRLNQCQLKKEA